jgi:hypothetical protein
MDYEAMVEELYEDYYEDLNDWEQSFVGSVRERINAGRDLTTSQEDKIEEIYERVS